MIGIAYSNGMRKTNPNTRKTIMGEGRTMTASPMNTWKNKMGIQTSIPKNLDFPKMAVALTIHHVFLGKDKAVLVDIAQSP